MLMLHVSLCDIIKCSTIEQHNGQNVSVVKPSLFASLENETTLMPQHQEPNLSESAHQFLIRTLQFVTEREKWLHISSACMPRFQSLQILMQWLDKGAAFGIYLKFCVDINYSRLLCVWLHRKEDTSLLYLLSRVWMRQG